MTLVDTRPVAGASADDGRDAALLAIMGWLSARDYRFVTPTPSTHALVRERSEASPQDWLRDVFGWVRPFQRSDCDAGLLTLMTDAGILDESGPSLRSTVRFSTVEGRLYVHSAPTSANDAVFLGPDSYRFERFLRHTLASGSFQTGLDIGTGAGVGALTLAALGPSARIIASDINPLALRYARVNARHAGLRIETPLGCGIPASPHRFDVIVANPPYIAGDVGKTYRDGGDHLGAALALDWARAAMPRLAAGGRFVLYTGSAIVRGGDFIRDTLQTLADEAGMSLAYDEIDPDVFGRSLRQQAYHEAERIAAIGAVVTAP